MKGETSMKKKSKHAPLRRRHEFRYHKVPVVLDSGHIFNIKHPAYIFLEKGNIFIYVSLTHSKKVGENIVIELKKNPNSKDQSKSYWIVEFKEDTKNRFGRKLPDWKIDKFDDLNILNEYKKSKE